jgi:putative phage-type endonuclease
MEDDLNELLEEAFDIFINTYNIERTPESASITDDDEIVERIDYLRSKPQPDQRTKEWYEFRHNLITASNAYKAFESQAMVNQLIYEKCQPIKSGNDDKLSMVNVNTTFHWGQKYEPLSVMIYEDMYNTKVEDFGCIQHDTHNFLGASPDGINVDKTSDRYGRMLEIKNIVNREITGIPKKEYWIQTQLQMEVCDLNECDFLETKFTEYETANDFFNDETDKKKGIILYFNTKEGKPFYIYKPLDILTVDEITEWEQETIDKHQANNMMWIKNLYWKLEIMSCVLILRNRKWFEDNIEQLGKVWKIIEEERITGYQHRAPNKRIKKEIQPQVTEGCLLDLTKFTPLKNLDH